MQKYRQAYHSQKSHAEDRGIEWQFTYATWLAWWGDDLPRRGTGRDNLQMQRIADSGPYHPDNVRKGVPQQNADTYSRMYQHKASRAARAAILNAEMEKPAAAKGYFVDELTDLQKELIEMRLPHKSRYAVYGV